jgi:ABC-2 type transport system permease protein
VTAAATGARPAGDSAARPMGLWRLEWLRLARTPRALALGAVYVAFGLIEPVITKYQRTIFSHLGGGVQIKFPAVTPAAGISSYVSELSGIGLIVVVVVAAGALTMDSRQGLAIFLRTRVTSSWQLVIPRFAVNAAAAAVAYLLGTLAAWYETKLLIGSLPAGEMIAGVAFGALYLAFAVAVTAFSASIARGTLATAGITLAALLVLPIAGTLGAVHDWLPSSLVNAPVDLLTGAHASHYLPAAGTAIVASVLLLILAVARLRNREV